MRLKWIFVSFLFILIINFVFASQVENSIPIQIQTLDNSGTVITGTFTFKIDISNSSSCSPVLYSNTTTQTTDSRGIVSYNIDNVNLDFSEQYYFCYYRDGTLKSTVKAARVPYAFRAKNVSLSGVYVDTNFGVGNYNITTTGTLSAPIICLNGVCQSAWPAAGGGTTGIYASGNNSNGYYIQFTDGTMMQWANLPQTITTTQASNGIDYGATNWVVVFPVSFINTPTVTVTGLGVSTSVAWAGLAGTLTNSTGFTATPIASNTAGTLNLSWTAIGRWTALTNLTASSNYTWAVNSQGDIVLFNSNKEVGIGTTNPTSKLEVVGNTNITGNLTLGIGKIMFNTTDGTYVYYNGTAWYAFGTGTSGSGVPTGAIMAFNSASCPTGWTLADGSSGTPDLRGIFLRGSGTSGSMKYANGSYFGIGYGTYGNDSFQGHITTTDDGGNIYYNQIGSGIQVQTGAGIYISTAGIGGSPRTTHYHTLANDGTNGVPRTGAETSPAYYATIYCVKTTADSATSNTIWATSGSNVVLNNVSQSVSVPAIGGNFFQVQDRQPSGTSEQPAAAAAWLNRTLNTIMTNEISGASLSSNNISITLPAGAYFVEATSPTAQEQSLQITSQARIYDITHGITLLNGTTTYGQVATGSYVLIQNAVNGRFTLTSTSSISLQQWMGAIPTSGGWGQDSALASGNIYSNVMMWKIA